MGNTIFGFAMIGFLVASLAHLVGCLILSFQDLPNEPLVTVREGDPPEGDEDLERNSPVANVQGELGAGRALTERLTRKTKKLDGHIREAPEMKRYLFNRYEMSDYMNMKITTIGRIGRAFDYTITRMKFWGFPIIALYLGFNFCWPAMEMFGLPPWAGNCL